MGCTETKSDDEGYEEERPSPRRARHRRNDYQEDEEESNIDEEDFKDFEEIGSKSKNY